MNIGKYTGFLIKFFLFATILYLVWMPLAITYYLLVVKLQIAYFHLIGTGATLNFNEEFFYAQGMRDSIPPYIALVLATPGIRPLKRLFIIALGSGILLLFRVILLISYTYLSLFQGEFYGTFVIFLSGTFRIALPLLIWFLFANKQILPGGRFF
jgi:hypothetical protein